MNLSTLQVESIVQSVLRQLQDRGVNVATSRPTPTRKSRPGTSSVADSQTVSSAALHIAGKVVTEGSLIAAQAAGQEIQLEQNAIVTPSGHDYIRQNQITIAGTNHPVSSACSTGAVVGTVSATAAFSAAATAGWKSVKAECGFQAAQLTRELLPLPVVCCLDDPSPVACLLNRDSSVRAAVVSESTSLETLIESMQPGVLCLESSRWSFSSLLRLLRKMSTSRTSPPTSWKEL